jgi:hypothetical protein
MRIMEFFEGGIAFQLTGIPSYYSKSIETFIMLNYNMILCTSP